MRDAVYLSGQKPGSAPAILVDIGGTTTDIGFLLPSGFP
jgi:N-methylhydantoinase A/oxoprolinase/acetone carboxylase beta subunit